MKQTWALVLLGASLLVACAAEREGVHLLEVRRGDFESTLPVRGRLEAAETYQVRPESWGKLSYLIPEGSEVKEGDLLFALETVSMEDNLEQAHLDLVVAEANLSKILEDVRLQQIKDSLNFREKEASHELALVRLEQATEDLARVKRQVDAQILARAALPDAEFNVRQARLNVDKGEIDKRRSAEERRSKAETQALDLKGAEARASKERTKVAEAEDYLSKANVRAPRAGVVVYARRHRGQAPSVGEQVGPHRAVLELPDTSVMIVRVEVNEVDIADVKVGMPLRVRVEAFPRLELAGEVSEVSGLAKELKDREGRNTGVRVFEVLVKLAEQDPRMRPGMTAHVELIRERRKDVLLVPLAAVGGQGKTAHVVTASGRKRDVEVLATDITQAVVSGDLKDGDRVRALLAGSAEPAEEGEAAE